MVSWRLHSNILLLQYPRSEKSFCSRWLGLLQAENWQIPWYEPCLNVCVPRQVQVQIQTSLFIIANCMRANTRNQNIKICVVTCRSHMPLPCTWMWLTVTHTSGHWLTWWLVMLDYTAQTNLSRGTIVCHDKDDSLLSTGTTTRLNPRQGPPGLKRFVLV